MNPSIDAVAEPATRYHYMDNLRALAMLTGVVFHASLAYSPMLHFFWLTADQQSPVIDVFAWFSHLFRMPVFFLIAGFFATFLLEKRGLKRFLINRSMRVLLPFLIFLPLVLWAIVAGIEWAATAVEKPSPSLYFLSNMTGDSEQPINTSHLWFLYYLCLFYVAWLLLRGLRLAHGTWVRHVMRPWVVVCLMPLLLIPAFYSTNAPHPAPETLHPLLWPFGLYGVFFLFGSWLYNHQQLIQGLYRWLPWMLLAGLGSYGYFAHRVPAMEGTLLMALSEAVTAWYLTLACVVAGHRWLNQHNPVVRYFADASYWIYLIHIPVLFMVQFVFLDLAWNLWLEFFLSTVITLVIGLLTYAGLVRWSPIGWLLNGKRR